MNLLIKQEIKIIMVLNKMDLGGEFIDNYVNSWKRKIEEKRTKKDPLIYYLPISAKTLKNIDTLKNIILENLPIQPPFYEASTFTDFPLKFRIADVVREKLFLSLKQELPHSLAVEVEEMEEKENITFIKVNIYVNRISQKKIVIGTKGSFLKEIGTESRGDLEKILNKKVYLNLWVKVLEDWQDKPRILQELGYWVA
jgi:GTP-binding protein Era